MVARYLPKQSTVIAEDAARILVVDDEPINRFLLTRIFQDKHVCEAETGIDALKFLQQEHFDIVLLDIMMPDMSGLVVLEALRSMPNTVDLPVVLISALSDTEDIVRGLRLGANDYITKPMDIELVLARIETQLEMKRMMDVHKQTIAALEAAEQMKDRLLRIASHDLKSPLTNIRTAESLLRLMLKEQPAAVEVLDAVNSTVNRMNRVITDFLEMAAVQSGTIDLYITEVPVETVIREVVEQYRQTAADKQITFELGDLNGTARADYARLSQAISNLVSNAIKYSPKGSTVSLWSEGNGDKVCLFVADQGPGIPAEERPLLFKEFSKLSTRPTDGEDSTGLGLWIVQQMITLQGGQVGVECPPEGGSVFWIELPSNK